MKLYYTDCIKKLENNEDKLKNTNQKLIESLEILKMKLYKASQTISMLSKRQTEAPERREEEETEKIEIKKEKISATKLSDEMGGSTNLLQAKKNGTQENKQLENNSRTNEEGRNDELILLKQLYQQKMLESSSTIEELNNKLDREMMISSKYKSQIEEYKKLLNVNDLINQEINISNSSVSEEDFNCSRVYLEREILEEEKQFFEDQRKKFEHLRIEYLNEICDFGDQNESKENFDDSFEKFLNN